MRGRVGDLVEYREGKKIADEIKCEAFRKPYIYGIDGSS
jgi:hypothetical protein